MKKKILNQLFVVPLFVFFISKSYAANYYWRATAINNLYTDIGNWETTPGGGLSPATAPTVNDDVFFPAALATTSNINLNGGFCRNFSFNAAAAFTFSGSYTINGSLIANGNAFFTITGSSQYNGTTGNTLTFSGSGTHSIDMGTSAQRFSGGGGIFFTSNTAGGTYSLINHNWITDNMLRFNTQHFISNGLQLDVRLMTVEGTATRTINFANSTINVNGTISTYSDNLFSFDLISTSANYILTNTRVVANGVIFQMSVAKAVAIGSLVLNGTSSTLHYRSGIFELDMDSLIINNNTLYFGRSGIDNTNTTVQTINPKIIRFVKPAIIENYSNTTLGSTHTVIEASLCRGQSVIQSMSNQTLKFNPVVALSTTGLAYRSVVFGGSGVTASSSYNLGLNSGSVSWTAVVPSTNFYWVGGNGSWNDPTKWSLVGSGGAPQSAAGCTPTFTDDVIFDINSFTTNQTVTIGADGGYCRNIIFNDPSNEGLLQSNNLNINGSANFSGARGVTSTIRFLGSGMHSITSGTAFTYNTTSVTLAGTGTYTLTDHFTANVNTTYFYHLSGTLNTNGRNMTVGQFSSRSYPSIPDNIRHIDITNSEVRHRALNPAGGYIFLDNSYLGSFTASGSHIVQIDNTIRFRVATVANNIAGNYLTSVVFNDISFTSTNGTTSFASDFVTGTSVSYNNVHFATNATITKAFNIPHTVTNYWLSSGRLYQLTNGYTYTITGEIQHIDTGCGDLVRINSITPGSRTNLFKASAPFNVNGAIVKDINASGTAMNVIGGQDAGNNLNVTVSAATNRDMYWVNGTGNWSNGAGHWSIGVSGGNPAITNPLGCIPRLVDNVFFDQNSFSSSNQMVTIDVDAECRNMLWDANAGSDQPLFAGASTRVLSVWGTLTFGTGMTIPFNGNITMMGASPAINAQSIITNSVVSNAQINMNGGGRYDQLDMIHSNAGLSLNSGSFYANDNDITAGHLFLDVRTPNAADISGSKINLNTSRAIPNTSVFYTYYAYHSGTGNWNATGSSIRSNQREFTINNSVPVTYDTIVMNATVVPQLGSVTTQTVSSNRIEWLTPTSNTTGNITTKTLIYRQSSVNNLQAGRTVLVSDSLVAHGTPCIPTTIKSSTPGSAAVLSSGNCSFSVYFGTLTDITAGTCPAAANKVIGTNGGNATNWTFTTINPLSPLGDDTLVPCNLLPFIQGTKGFGEVPATYLWSTGETTSQIGIMETGTYTVTVTYAPGCSASGTRTVEVIDTVAPTKYTSVPTFNMNTCYEEAQQYTSFVTSSILPFYTDDCHEMDSISIVITDTTLITDDCGWEIMYTYDVVDQAGNALSGETLVFSGADVQAPLFHNVAGEFVRDTIEKIFQPSDLNLITELYSLPVFSPAILPTIWLDTALMMGETGVDTGSIESYSGNPDHTSMMRVATFPFELTDTLCPNTSYSLYSKVAFTLEEDFSGTSAEDLHSVIALYRDEGGGNYSFVTTSPITEFSPTNIAGYQDSLILTSELLPGNYRLVVLSESIEDTVHFHSTYQIREFYFIANLSGCNPDTVMASCISEIPDTNPLMTDNCSNAILTYDEIVSEETCANTFVLTRNWTATDACGNTNTYTEIFSVNDTINPVFVQSLPTDTTVNCNAIPTEPTITATDNCSATAVVTYSEITTTGLCTDTYTLTRTWTATDACNNSTTHVQIIQVQDTISPVFVETLPQDTVVNCDAVPTAPVLTATDNCSAVVVNYNESTTPGSCVNTYTLTRIWDVSDACNNTTMHIQTIHVQDTVKPVFDLATLPVDTTVNCDAVPGTLTASLAATDNCSPAADLVFGVSETTTQGAAGTCAASNYVITRVYNVTDVCGNSQSYTQTIQVQDTISPAFIETLPRDTVVNCDAVSTAPVLTATDNCSAGIVVNYNETTTTGTCANSYTLTRTWSATDLCGNTRTHLQTVNVQDTVKPVFDVTTLPNDTTVNCDVIPVILTTSITATDNCSSAADLVFGVNETSTQGATGTCEASNYVITRVYNVTDVCGNSQTYTQIIQVQDTLHPVFDAATLPNDTTVNCDAIPAVLIAVLTATDNCSSATDLIFAVSETTTQGVAGTCEASNYVITRVYRVTDACGNDQTYTQTLVVQDTVKPVFDVITLPHDTIVNCDAVPGVLTASLTAIDNCSSATDLIFTVSETTTQGATGTCAENNYVITRMYSVTDVCGNSQTYTQIIQVQDTLAPVFTEPLPQDIVVNCDAVPTAPVITATDNCVPTAAVNYNETTNEGPCPGTYTLTRTWAVMDICGNTRTHLQTISVQDTSGPVIVGCPSDTVVQTTHGCEALVTWTAPTATDNCGAVTVTSSHTSGAVFFVGPTTVTYTFTDECGNASVCSFIVLVQDTIAPEITITDVVTSVCEGTPITWTQTVTDNCGSVTVINSHNSGEVFPVGTTTVTITATDAGGNVSVSVFDVTVISLSEIAVTAMSQEKCIGTPVVLSVKNPDNTLAYTWLLSGVEVGAGSTYSISSVQATHAGVYTVVAQNADGCRSEEQLTLTVESCGITISETFSPNGDGQNELFYVEGLEAFPNTKVWIHNRWGLEVYHSDNYQNDWDGRSQSKLNVADDELPEGTYYYILQLGGNEGQLNAGEVYKGYVYIKR